MRSIALVLALCAIASATLYAYAAGLRAAETRNASTIARSASVDGVYVPLDGVIRRDPFAGAPKAPRPKPTATEAFQAFDLFNGPGDVVASDSRTNPPETTPAFVLKATIVGDIPVAYLSAGKTLRIVRVGDFVGERKVIAIDPRGITLLGGDRLNLESTTTAPKARAVAGQRGTARPRAKQELTTPSASPTPVMTSAPDAPTTPGPLPTIKSGAYPIGSRPTPDRFAPTAFPYPYPYPPK